MGSKKNPKAKEPIKIRFKKLANGNKSVYLDCYRNGVRAYEFLKLYIVPERTKYDKAANVETMRTANAVKAQKIVEMQNTEHGFSVSGRRSRMNIVDYIKAIAEKKRVKGGGDRRGTSMTYLSLARQIEDYSGAKTTFRQIDKKYCAGFIEHLKTAKNRNTGLTLHVNTQTGYMKKFETVLNTAIAEEIAYINPFRQIKPENKPKKQRSEITYLTIDEVKTLEHTPCLCPSVKQSFLFSCYSGLRFSDIRDLTWEKLQKDNNGGILIKFVQKKTGKHEYLPIHQKAVELMPERRDAADTDRVFQMLTGAYVNVHLKTWVALSGLKKHLTFHVARHTYATMLMTLGARIEIVSKNLGHSDIKTTQLHYAAIENKLQREAVNLFDRLTME